MIVSFNNTKQSTIIKAFSKDFHFSSPLTYPANSRILKKQTNHLHISNITSHSKVYQTYKHLSIHPSTLMKILKHETHSLFPHPVMLGGKQWLSAGVMIYFDLMNPDALLSEQEFS